MTMDGSNQVKHWESGPRGKKISKLLGWEVMTTEMPLELIDEKKCQCGNREEMQEQIKELQLRISHLEKMAGPK